MADQIARQTGIPLQPARRLRFVPYKIQSGNKNIKRMPRYGYDLEIVCLKPRLKVRLSIPMNL